MTYEEYMDSTKTLRWKLLDKIAYLLESYAVLRGHYPELYFTVLRAASWEPDWSEE